MQQKYHKYASLTKLDDQVLQNKTLVFNVEETLLKSFSMFPYFMLVAFEGGGPLRALILLFLYPFMCIFVNYQRYNNMKEYFRERREEKFVISVMREYSFYRRKETNNKATYSS